MKAGDKIAGVFELIRPLYDGEGCLWLAHEITLRRDVVLKFQDGVGEEARAALLAEAAEKARRGNPFCDAFCRVAIDDASGLALYAMKAPAKLLDAKLSQKEESARSAHIRLALVAAKAATSLAIVAAALLCYSRLRKAESVVDVTISTIHGAEGSLCPRLPGFSAEAMRRIPWNCYVLSYNNLAEPKVKEFRGRVKAFEVANPDLKSNPICSGALRIIRLPGDIQLELAGIPYGFFRRGFFLSSNSADGAEREVSPDTVSVSRPFWMARTELTRAQYAAVMRSAPAVAGFPARRLWPWEGRFGRPLNLEGGDLPVGEDLDLAEVERFINALNALCGLEGERCFRLPTEAEWEHACRAFVAWPFEKEPDPGAAAWGAENSGGTAHPVAKKAQNPFGLFDIHGNLAEWCADGYGPFGDWADFDPFAEPASNSAPRAVRGGSFRDSLSACGSDARVAASPSAKGFAIRLVVSL